MAKRSQGSTLVNARVPDKPLNVVDGPLCTGLYCVFQFFLPEILNDLIFGQL